MHQKAVALETQLQEQQQRSQELEGQLQQQAEEKDSMVQQLHELDAENSSITEQYNTLQGRSERHRSVWPRLMSVPQVTSPHWTRITRRLRSKSWRSAQPLVVCPHSSHRPWHTSRSSVERWPT